MNSLEMAKAAAKFLSDKKAQDVKVLKIDDLTILTDYFVIATGTSSTQVKSLAEEVEFKLGELGVKPMHVDGRETRSWIALDYNTVIIHVFYPEDRKHYDLESLWADGVEVPLED